MCALKSKSFKNRLINVRTALFLAAILCAFASDVLTSTARAQGIKTDRAVYTVPALSLVPNAGDKFNDPVFGTQIMRATNGSECPTGCGTWYSHWPTFNSDNTRILIRNGTSGDVIIKAFDPVGFTLGSPIRTTSTITNGYLLQWQGATWSRTDPDLIYITAGGYDPNYPATGMKLYTYRPSSNTLTLLRDFAPQLAPGQPDYFFEMHIAQDGNDDIFTLMHYRLGQPQNPIYYVVWRRSTNTVLHHILNDTTFDANAAAPDKSGRWVWFPLNKTQPDLARHRVLDLQTNTWQTVYWTGADDPPSHGDVGTGTNVGRGAFGDQPFNLRPLSNVHSIVNLFDYKDSNGLVDKSNDQHTSLHADDESWAMVGVFDDPSETGTETGAFENEVMQIAMDGSQRIRRLFHHRSHYDDLTPTTGYWASPKPTISRDGRFIAFTSNWGNSGRYDLFIAKIDSPSSSPPPQFNAKINFQPDTASVPSGYLADGGNAYANRGNGHSYGWDGVNTGGARDRNFSVSPDQRYDTLVAMQYSYNATWEIAVPNGTYTVHLVAGDPEYYDPASHVYKVNVEGVLTVNGSPSSTQRWVEGTQTVTVSDGKLTVSNASGSINNTLCFIEITSN